MSILLKDKEFWEDFIDIYRRYPCLWDIKNKEYSNKPAKNSAYSELIEKCKDISPDADKSFVCKRIANMRTAFRRELKKVRDSKRTGCATEEIYSPSLWYFDLLLFLSEGETGRVGTSSLEEPDERYFEEEGENEVEHNVFLIYFHLLIILS